MMYYGKDTIMDVRGIGLLDYLQRYEPDNLRRVSPGVFCTKEHDSLRISNGKWYWFSQGFGGCSALDYLIKVKNLPFTTAMERLHGKAAGMPSFFAPRNHERKLALPTPSPSSERAAAYLLKRGIGQAIIDYCLRTGLLYESLPYHNAVFVGFDARGQPRYAALRGVNSSFKGEARGSDKRFAFRVRAADSAALHVFEGAVDLLSYAALETLDGRFWRRDHLLSLGGVSGNGLPPALGQFLHDERGIRKIGLHLDNDPPGRRAAECIMDCLRGRYALYDLPPPQGKDYIGMTRSAPKYAAARRTITAAMPSRNRQQNKAGKRALWRGFQRVLLLLTCCAPVCIIACIPSYTREVRNGVEHRSPAQR